MVLPREVLCTNLAPIPSLFVLPYLFVEEASDAVNSTCTTRA